MKKIKTLVRKEILDILRDKKTLVIMVLIPVLLYPLIIIGTTLVFSMMMDTQETEVYTVCCQAEYEGLADKWAGKLTELYEEMEEEPGVSIEFLTVVPGIEEQAESLADVWLKIEKETDGREQVTLSYDSSDQKSRYAEETVEYLLENYREELVTEKLDEEGLGEEILYPIIYLALDQASVSESFAEDFGSSIGGSLGMMLIITILLGAVYPAIDATAGEKERGTLETLLTLPVTNFQMIFSKYLSVALFACVTAVLSVLSLGGSVLFLLFGVSSDMMGELPGIYLADIVSAIPVLLLVLVVTALLTSALCMIFCVFARSFKEANNYVTPVMLVVMFASMTAMVPSVILDYRTVLIPIVNVSLLVKQILSGQFDMVLAGIAAVVNLGYSVLIIWVLAKMYDSENILFSDGFRSFRIFQKRSDIRKGTIPAAGDLVLGITVLFLLLLYVGSAASVRLGFWGTAVSQLLILLVPLAVVWYMKSDVKELFSLKKPCWSMLPGSLFLYLGTYCLVLGLAGILTALFPESTENLENTFSVLAEQPLLVMLFVTAVMPAVGEEILFRGFLFGSLCKNLGRKTKNGHGTLWALLISALVFGAFHMSIVKLLPTALLGAAFAWIVYRTGSIYVSMFLHFLNNAVSMVILKYPEQISRWVPVLTKEKLSAAELGVLLTGGAILSGIGIFLMKNRQKRTKTG